MGQFGVGNSATLFGFVLLCHQLGAFAGSYGAGVLREATGSCDLWWWLAAALGIVAAALHLGISDRPAARSGDAEPEHADAGVRLGGASAAG